MELHAKTVRSQLNFFKPFVANCSLEVTRKGQDKLGELMTALHKREVMVKEHDFGRFQGAWIMPKDERRNGVVLYLHGGGYTCGSLEYAKGISMRRSHLRPECAYSARLTGLRPKTATPQRWTMRLKATTTSCGKAIPQSRSCSAARARAADSSSRCA